MESPKKTAARAKARRRRLLIRVGAVAAVALAVGGVFVATRPDDAQDAAGTTPGFTDADRPVDTTPFELAGPNVTGPTTIPGEVGSASEPTVPPATLPPATTSTTLPIPDVGADIVECRMTRAVIEGLRIITGPSGLTPENLQAGAAKYREAADIALNSGQPGTAPVALLVAQMAIDLPGVRTLAEAEEIHTRLTAPTDPAIVPVVQAFGVRIQEACPELLSIEP
jgi:hypothetical protein